MEPITKFWLVWNPGRSAPTYRHFSKASARSEAERLSRTYPGETFIVLVAVDAVISPVLDPQSVKLTKPTLDDEIPF